MSLYNINNSIKYSGYVLFDISRRFTINKTIKNNPMLYQEYIVQGDESAEDIAQDFYGDAKMYWLIYLINDIIDPFYGWLLSEQELNLFVEDKYGTGNVNSIHHGNISNIQYETAINDSKRKIRIIRPSHVDNIVNIVTTAYE